MASVTVYGLKTCDTCRKAVKALDAAERTVTFHDVRIDGVTRKKIEGWAKTVGWTTLLNKASTTWRSLANAEKADIDEKKALALMVEHPTLIKRPVIEKGLTEVYVGWGADVQRALGF